MAGIFFSGLYTRTMIWRKKKKNLGVRLWNKDSQVLEGILQEHELEQAELGLNSCIITDHEDSDGMCDGQSLD